MVEATVGSVTLLAPGWAEVSLVAWGSDMVVGSMVQTSAPLWLFIRARV